MSPPLSPADRRRHRKLLARIHRRFQTVTEPVRAGEVELAFTRIADPNLVLDQVAEEEDRRDKLAGRRRDGDELHLPYWAELWDSSLAIIDFLARTLPERFDVRRLSVLDLGCGMGLTGSVAAALGARVLFADLEPDALLFARLNATPFARRIRTRRLNWQKARLTEQFDLIIGADILYDRTQWIYLEPFWRGHLRAGGSVLLGEPGRQTGDLFLDWIKPYPWKLEQLKKSVPTRTAPIRIFELTGRT
ncbi:MAG TPA: methyltransferase domain-containing protein [Tepidisphaeraceae bacterium]|jgi:predicted nicotinamide N-methyase